MSNQQIVISGVGLWTPPHQISNEELVVSYNAFADRYNAEHQTAIEAGELAAKPHSSAEFIEKASGIRSRYVYIKDGILDPARMTPQIPLRDEGDLSDQAEIAVEAAKKALAAANKTASDIDAVIVSCAYTQRYYPAIAIEVQEALGIKGFGFDMLVACSAATFALQRAYEMVAAGTARAVLTINPELTSPQNNFRDRDSHFIFGDVATAVIIEAQDTCQSDGSFEIIGTKLFTQFSNNIRNNFGFLNRTAPEGIGATDKLFVQDGRRVFKEVLPLVVNLIETHISETGLNLADIRRLWLHQANKNMNDYIGKKIFGRDPAPEEQPNVLQDFANTSSAGSMICFHKHHDNLQSQDMGVICSFGAGYSAGSIIVKKS